MVYSIIAKIVLTVTEQLALQLAITGVQNVQHVTRFRLPDGNGCSKNLQITFPQYDVIQSSLQ